MMPSKHDDVLDNALNKVHIGFVASAGGLIAGLLLGYGLAPKFQVVREPVIPDGSTSVPEGALMRIHLCS